MSPPSLVHDTERGCFPFAYNRPFKQSNPKFSGTGLPISELALRRNYGEGPENPGLSVPQGHIRGYPPADFSHYTGLNTAK